GHSARVRRLVCIYLSRSIQHIDEPLEQAGLAEHLPWNGCRRSQRQPSLTMELVFERVADRVLSLADTLLDAAFSLLSLAFGLHALVARRLTDLVFDSAGHLLCGSLYFVLVHGLSP